eukprot:jgi/Mesvir1/1387/Mv22570-RA.1
MRSGRCTSSTKTGSRCRRAAVPGGRHHCAQHATRGRRGHCMRADMFFDARDTFQPEDDQGGGGFMNGVRRRIRNLWGSASAPSSPTRASWRHRPPAAALAAATAPAATTTATTKIYKYYQPAPYYSYYPAYNPVYVVRGATKPRPRPRPRRSPPVYIIQRSAPKRRARPTRSKSTAKKRARPLRKPAYRYS